SPFVRMDVALIGLAVYFLLSIHTFLSAKVAGEFNLTYLAGGPTELRLILIAMSLAMFWGGAIPAGDSIFTVFDVFILVLASILMIVFLVQTAAMAARLRRLGQ
nr:CDP-alcohol phosphatidyltransferase family protein [Sphingopyxis sp.]